ncbi:MAG: ABC transporter substrate-binding protein [Dysgonomonas sp.]|nr:ABC transporter substrate-binding protein [Dysgonomonas sp.]
MKKNGLYIPFFLLLLVFAACNNKADKQNSKDKTQGEYTIHYAKGFQVKKYTDYTEVSVHNPWDTTRLLQKYILIDREKEIPANLPAGTIVKIPLKSVVAYNTIHCSTLNELGMVDLIKGVCEPQYVKTEKIKKGVEAGTIVDLGMASKPDIEKIIMLSPEAILAAPISGQTYGNVGKTGIPVIETPDYTEPHPLGRAEWIRFYSLFIDKEQLADSLFNRIAHQYNEIKEAVANATSRPSVFPDTKYQGSWNMPGGKSFMANMLADAGGAYVWAEDNSSTFLPLSFETVLDKAGEADLWLIRYYAPEDMTYKSLEKEFKPYSYFKAFKERNIYGCNTFYSNFYEDLPIHPEYILMDFAKIFHPELFPDYTLKYYMKMN